MPYGTLCRCREVGGVGVGVDAMDWRPSKELRADCEWLMPFMEVSVLCWEKVGGGGGYADEPAWKVDAMELVNGLEKSAVVDTRCAGSRQSF